MNAAGVRLEFKHGARLFMDSRSDDPCRAYARQNAVNINNKARYLHCIHLGIRWLLRNYIARKEPHYHQEHK